MAYFEFTYLDSKTHYPVYAEMFANAESERPIKIGQIDMPVHGQYRGYVWLPHTQKGAFKTMDEAAKFMLIEAYNWLSRMGLEARESSQ